jgi:hypothetical protein
MNTRPQRFIALLLIISPWLYVPTVFKEVLFIVLGVALFLVTIDLRKKKKEEGFETKAASFIESRPAAI